MPSALTPMVGREAHVERLNDLLTSNGVRLVSIVGLGGMGKTRLALAAGQRLVDARLFSHGVFFVELATASRPEQIVNAIAEGIGLALQAGDRRAPKAQLVDYLAAKEMALLLDNFEHLVESADLLAELLQMAPRVKILVTSRERLRLPGEQVFPILGLDQGDADRGSAAQASAAVQLFVQSAQRAAPGFDLSEQNSAQAVEICRLVEGCRWPSNWRLPG
ncbi:MAG: AAA family ATPase [Caldilineaceae bacterium]|nr:AAA family ATPase [Caldilineaceae bacterium]